MIPIPAMPPETAAYPCPVCGKEHPEYLLRNRTGAVLGCCECLAEDPPEHYYENRRWRP